MATNIICGKKLNEHNDNNKFPITNNLAVSFVNNDILTPTNVREVPKFITMSSFKYSNFNQSINYDDTYWNQLQINTHRFFYRRTILLFFFFG